MDLEPQFFAELFQWMYGPFSFRFVLPPMMAMLFAIRDGTKDAREYRPPYFLQVFPSSDDRDPLLLQGWKAVGNVIGVGVVMDLLYQAIELRAFHPGELIVVVLTLAFVPYLLMRGPANRLARAWMSRKAHAR